MALSEENRISYQSGWRAHEAKMRPELERAEAEVRWWRILVQQIADEPLNKDCPARYVAKAALAGMPQR